jgi:hypothetical protein
VRTAGARTAAALVGLVSGVELGVVNPAVLTPLLGDEPAVCVAEV